MSTDVQVVDTGLDKQSRRRSKDTEKAHRRSSNFQSKKYKHDHKFRKKIAANGKFFPPYKKRNKDFIIPPTKFLLGGNITDPLNLNSLQDEDINRAMNAVTPKSSPLPTPKHRKGEVEVIIPPDITDPLNLIAGDDDATYEAMLTSPIKKTAKKQKKSKKRRNHRNSSGPSSGKEDSIEGAKLDQTDPSPVSEEKTETQDESKKDGKAEEETKDVKETPLAPPPVKRHKSDHNNRTSLRKIELKERKADLDKIVSPVIPQPGAWTDRHRFRLPQRTPQIDKSQAKELPKFKESNAKFQYGNYSRYYGYRNPNQGSDLRFRVFEKHKNLFEGKDVLDIGCNTGHLTLAIARDFHPNRVVGMDIDRSLINAARANIRHYVNCGKKDKFFPVSMPIVYGPIEIPGVNEEKGFPHNISFVQGNYVLESDVLLSLEQPQFDVILCLSITKWIQLNWGDAGLKRAFKRMFAQLRPGGVLILEAQSWSSYKRKRNLTPDTWKNYHAVEFFPQHFTPYLLNEVGFSKCEVIGAPVHPSRGFQRPIKMFIKEDPSFDTPRPISQMGGNTERFESYSFRLPDSVHGPDDFSGDSNFPYETPNSFNSPESGFSEGLHPRRYHMRYPLDEVVEGGGGGEEEPVAQGDGTSSAEGWRPPSAEESTMLSADSSSQSNIEEAVEEGGQQEENGGIKMEVVAVEEEGTFHEGEQPNVSEVIEESGRIKMEVVAVEEEGTFHEGEEPNVSEVIEESGRIKIEPIDKVVAVEEKGTFHEGEEPNVSEVIEESGRIKIEPIDEVVAVEEKGTYHEGEEPKVSEVIEESGRIKIEHIDEVVAVDKKGYFLKGEEPNASEVIEESGRIKIEEVVAVEEKGTFHEDEEPNTSEVIEENGRIKIENIEEIGGVEDNATCHKGEEPTEEFFCKLEKSETKDTLEAFDDKQTCIVVRVDDGVEMQETKETDIEIGEESTGNQASGLKSSEEVTEDKSAKIKSEKEYETHDPDDKSC